MKVRFSILLLLAQSASRVIGADSTLPNVRAIPRMDADSRIAHEQMVARAKKGGIDIYFVGDSITRRWGARDRFANEAISKSWITNFSGWKAANFGWGGDTVENVLWRVENGELDGVNPRVIVVLAGINNVGAETDGSAAHIAGGIKAIIEVCEQKAPVATIIVTAIFPRNDNMAVIPVINDANEKIAMLADGQKVRFVNINRKIADETGKFLPGMVGRDKLHPTVKTYEVWAEALKPIFTEILGPPARPQGDAGRVQE